MSKESVEFGGKINQLGYVKRKLESYGMPELTESQIRLISRELEQGKDLAKAVWKYRPEIPPYCIRMPFRMK